MWDYIYYSMYFCIFLSTFLMLILLYKLKNHFCFIETIVNKNKNILEEHNIRQDMILSILEKLQLQKTVNIEKIQENAERLNTMMLEIKGVVAMSRSNIRLKEHLENESKNKKRKK